MTPFARRTLLLAAAAAAVGVACAAPAAGAFEPPSRADRTTDEESPGPTPAEVEATQRALDARAPEAPSSVVSWGVDPAVGLVVVAVSGERTPEVDRFLAGVDPRTYRLDTAAEPARPLPGSSPAGS